MAIMQSVDYEVAIEVLGQSLQPLITALADERQKAAPSPALVQYLEGRIASIEQLQTSSTRTIAPPSRRSLRRQAQFSPAKGPWRTSGYEGPDRSM